MEEIARMELILLLVNVNLDAQDRCVKPTLMTVHQTLVKMEECELMD